MKYYGLAALCCMLTACGGGMGGSGSSMSNMSSNPGMFGSPVEMTEDSFVEERQGGSYEFVGVNPYVVTLHDPNSTFATDVDTASYDVFRRDIESFGELPSANSVRVEEYVNAFTYEYPKPAEDSEHPFAIQLDASPNIKDNGTVLMRVGIQGKDEPNEGRKPANLVFLVDTSGSMNGSARLPLVKSVLSQAMDLLQQGDTISIVTYAGRTGVVLEPTDVVGGRTEIDAALNRLQSSGGTAGSAGLDLAYQQARAGFIEGGVNHIILCTDGDFNIGPSDNVSLINQIKENRKSGVTFTALGFGSGNLNDAMLEAISNAGNGFYGVIGSTEHAKEYVENRLLSTVFLIAKDVKVQVEFNPQWVQAYRLIGYENRDLADSNFRNDVIDAGEVGAGHSVTALYELVLTGSDIPQPENAPELDDGAPYGGDVEVDAKDIVKVKLRYKQVDAQEQDSALELSESLDGSVGIAMDMSDDFSWAAGVAMFAEKVKGSPYGAEIDIQNLLEVLDEAKRENAERVKFYGLAVRASSRL